MRYCSSTLVVVFSLMLAAVGPARAEVLIGNATDLTGPTSWYGEQQQVGTDLAVADLNAKGGVLDEQIRVITVDDACNAEQAVAAARKLISDRVVLVIGHVCSGAAIPTAPSTRPQAWS